MKENFQRLEKTVETGFENINNQLTMMSDTYVRKSEHKLQDEQMEGKILTVKKEVEELKESNNWVFRTVGLTVLGTISAIIVALFK